MFKVFVACAILCLLLAGCSQDRVGFTAPHGWTGTPRLVNFPQQFTNPADPKQYILIAHPTHPRPASYPASEHWTPIEICSNHAALLMRMRGTIGGKDVQMDGVDTTWGRSRVMAMYARPYGTPADPAAETAIRSLCE